MSCFFSMPYADRIEILTDGASYDHDGVMQAFTRKVWPSEHLPVAIVGRGNAEVFEKLAVIFHAATEGKTVNESVKAWATILDQLKRRPETRRDNNVEMLIAGLSETHGPFQLYWASFPRVLSAERTLAPFTFQEWAGDFGGYAKPPNKGEMALLRMTPEKMAAGLESWGVEFMEILRRKRGQNPYNADVKPFYAVGGFVDLTIVRPEGVTVKRLHTWPDMIGRKINPFIHEVVAA